MDTRHPDRPTRRDALALGLGTVAAATGALGPASAGSPPTLKAAAANGGIAYGAAGGDELLRDEAYRDLFGAQAALLTPTGALKIDAIQAAPDVFDFAAADALVDGARRRGLQVRGHTLAWNDWPPAWLKRLGAAETERAFDLWIERTVTHFAGRIVSWDVVNEPFYLGKDKPGTWRAGPWYDAMGPDYVFRAFRRTAALDPGAKLVLNEAWTEGDDPVGRAVRRSLLDLVDRIQDKGLKLDGVGLQGHLRPARDETYAQFGEFLEELARRKIEILITEFDVLDTAFPADSGARDRDVAACTAAFLRTVLAVPAVTTVVTWGLSDRYSWLNEPSVTAAMGASRLARPLPFDGAFERKPMADAMAAAFEARRRPG